MYYTPSILLFFILIIDAQSDRKSSLTFVIDVTRSMNKVLRQVEESVHTLFDVVLQANESHIENFILVTFDDPNVNFVIESRDIDEFIEALDNIELQNGGDCPEFCISGIKMAIEKSLPGSTIYVFTDAYASDYTVSDQVLDIAQRKEIQVIFVLTGRCIESSLLGYDVYLHIAKMTSGQVFNLLDDDVFEILEFVVESAKSRRTVAKTKTFPPGLGHKLNYTKDVEMKNTTITISGKGVKFNIIGPDGTVPDVENWVTLENVTGLKIYEKKDGVHTMTVDCESEANLILSARSKIYFRHGFSTFVPSSLNDTSLKPLQDDCYLTIQVFGIFLPQHVCLLDADDYIKTNNTLKLLDNKNNLFITTKIDPPLFLFRIAVTGIHRDSNKTITRISRMIQPNNSYIELPEDKIPTSYIEGSPKITVETGTLLRLKCKVNAYPEPTITWVKMDTREILNSTMFVIDIPYDYMSVYEEANVNENGTYICKSKNDHGNDIQSVVVETKPKLFFYVVETPEDITVEFNTNSDITCKVNASPPVNITWLKNDNHVLKEDHIKISPDGSVMTLLNMTLAHVGNYTYVVKNILNEKQYPFKVNISGIEAPFIEKHPSRLQLSEGSSANLSCSITKGKPKPNITWYYEDTVSKTLKEITQGVNKEMITLHDVRRNDPELYVCKAHNIVTSDHKDIKIDIEWSPQIFEISNHTIVTENDDLKLLCRIKDGNPTPSIQWFSKDSTTKSFIEIDLFKNEEALIIRNIKRNQRGTYKCVATNKIGNDTIETNVTVEYQPSIENNSEMITYMAGDEVTLICLTDGVPEPSIKWSKDDKPLNSTEFVSSNDQRLTFQVSLASKGLYKCEAINKLGTAIKTVKIEVEKAPTIFIDGSPKITAEYDEPLELKCHVSANPVPRIRWSDRTDISNALPGTIDASKFPYDLIHIVKIDKVTKNATYLCEAKNDHGTDVKQVDVETVKKSYFDVITTPKNITVELYTNSDITCKVNASPPVNITWLKNDNLVSKEDHIKISPDGSVMTLLNMTLAHVGNYTCVVKNILNEKQYPFKVNISGMEAPFIEKHPSRLQLSEGSSANLSCSITKGKPKPNITWYYEDTVSKTLKEITQGVNKEMITLHDVRRNDPELYVCKAHNIVTSDHKDIKIDIEWSPQIFEISNHTIVTENDDLKLLCRIKDGNPTPSIQWFSKDSTTKSFIEIDLFKNEEALIIRNIKRNQRGTYKCVATNKIGNDTIETNVTVEYQPSIENNSEMITYMAGDEVTLICLADGVPEPSIKWSKDDKPLNSTEFVSSNDQNLTFQVSLASKGLYKCEAINKLGTAIKTVKIEVEKAPTIFIDGSPKITAEYDEPLELKCHVSANPVPCIRWSDRTDISNALPGTIDASKFPYDLIHIVKIDKVTKNATYLCEAKNDHGTDVKQVDVETVKKSYFDVITTPKNITVELNTNSDITCKVNASPPVNITWLKNDNLVSKENHIKISPDGSVMTLLNMTLAHVGNYTCVVKNILNEKQYPFKVNISGMEAPFIEKHPSHLQLSERSSANLSCSITKGKPKPNITWYYEDTLTKTLKEITQGINKEMITLHGVRRNDPKLYVCKAHNIVTSDHKDIKIDIEWSPQIFEISNHTIVTENDDLKLLCRIKDGNPTPSIQWFSRDSTTKSFIEIDLFKNEEALILRNIKRNQRGTYKCVATNKIGNDTIQTNVTVEYQPSIENNSEMITYMAGNEVTLICLTDGVPEPSIKWSKDDKPLNSTEFVSSNDQRLTFKVSLASKGLYKCEAINKLGTAMKIVKIEVEKAPTIFIDGSPKITAEYDEPLELKCHVSANPVPRIRWSDGTDISNALPGTIDASKFPYDLIHIVKIDKVTKNATYSCEAENDHGTDVKQVDVKTVRKTYFNVITIPKDTMIDYNSEGKLYCKVNANPPAKIIWYKNSAYLTRKDGVELSADGTLTIKEMQPSKARTYTCVAKNAENYTRYNAEVSISQIQKPEIDKMTKDYYTVEGSNLELLCRLNKGSPLPKIRWFYKIKGAKIFGEIVSARNMTVLMVDGDIKKDRSTYMCEATNFMGSDTLQMDFHVEYPPSVKVGENYALNVGEELNAPCLVDGNPSPIVKWVKDGVPLPGTKISDNNSLRFVVNLNDGGVYTCYAANKHGTASKNVTVDVYNVRNIYKKKNVDELSDVDLLCKNYGRSRVLTKTWSYKSNDPESVPMPIQLIQSAKRNTFLIRRIRYDQAGTYFCNVTNVLGEKLVLAYKIDVYTPVFINKDMDKTAVEGDIALQLYCNATSQPKPKIKWFKNGLDLYNTDGDTLLLQNVQPSTQGEYMCVASNGIFSDKAVFSVKVQRYPSLNNPTTALEVVVDETVSVPCDLPFKDGDLLRWYKGNRKITEGKLTIFKVKPSDAGLYTCRVSNSSASVSANTLLSLSSKECLLKIDPYIEKQPLILTQYFTWPTFKYDSGYLRMPRNQSILLICPNKINNFDLPPYISAYCNEDAKLDIEGAVYDYSDIKCTEEIRPQIIKTGLTCYGDDTELIKVAFELVNMIFEVYEVCVSVSLMAPIIFTKHNMRLPMADTVPKEIWLYDGILQYNYDEMYDHERQTQSISSTLGRWFHRDDQCVFSKRQLVNALDVFPGLPQKATFSHLNVAPLWSTCSSENWDELESRVRRLAMSIDELKVWTGTTDTLGYNQAMYIVDDLSRAQSVPMYFWKVIQNVATRSSLAIIQINIPDISAYEVKQYERCTDICQQTTWMRGDHWNNVMKGYTYCCQLSDFESSFGYNGIFGYNVHNILYGF